MVAGMETVELNLAEGTALITDFMQTDALISAVAKAGMGFC